ncbi:MAG: hypothetical protein JNM19_12065, partial [Chitinophagaceae bacterium]|nr:hypothetical protein [Chitinophagaceae bacterium]
MNQFLSHHLKYSIMVIQRFLVFIVTCCGSVFCIAQKPNFKSGYPNNVNPIGIVKNIDDSTLLEIVQRQTFRFFW